jgi:hypothetical protein
MKIAAEQLGLQYAEQDDGVVGIGADDGITQLVVSSVGQDVRQIGGSWFLATGVADHIVKEAVILA